MRGDGDMEEAHYGGGGVFEIALQNSKDVTGTFCADFGWEPDESTAMLSFDRHVRAAIRVCMGQRNGGVRLIADVAAPSMEIARRLLDDGQVGAVDGTNALAKIDYMNTTKYACAVGWVTSRQRGTPSVVITKTSSAYVDPGAFDPLSGDTLKALALALDAARDAQSWPTTFREFQEREVALTRCEAPYVLLDGPIFTQNLLTQRRGQALYERLLRSRKTFIGVIKNVSGSTSMTRWSAASLRPGEMWVVGPVRQAITDRAEKAGGMEQVTEWIQRELADDYLRVVYRPCQKAFAFECHARDLELACALLLADASPTLNHEIPLLLETVDAQVRAGFNAHNARSANLARMTRQSLPGDPMEDYRDQMDVIDEREWR